MNAFQNFLEKAAELYLTAPIFFNWLFPSVFFLLCVIFYFAFWLGVKLEDAEKKGLKAQNEAVLAQLKLAEYQAMTLQKTIGEVQTDLNSTVDGQKKPERDFAIMMERLRDRGQLPE